MSTGFERLGRDPQLQDHWIRRVIAFVIDSVVVGACIMIIMGVVMIPLTGIALISGSPWRLPNIFMMPFFGGLLSVLYFALLETHYEYTLGKKIMKLKVAKLDGQTPTLNMAFIRNLSKIYWILLIADVVIGLATQGRPHQKLSDRFAGTTVITTAASSLVPTKTKTSANFCSHCGERVPAGARYCPSCGEKQD